MKYLYLLIAILFLGVACDDNDSLPTIKPIDSGTCNIDGCTYEWVRIGDQEWITSNLKAGTPYYAVWYDLDKYGEYVEVDFSGTEEGTLEERTDFNKYGNLYEWETAVEICKNLPDGWHLPTDEDWRKLEYALGMRYEEVIADGWRGKGVAELLRQGKEGSGFALQLGGNVSFTGVYYDILSVQGVKEKGYYWSATQQEDGRVYYRKLHYNSSEVYRGSTAPLAVPMMRVRVVRNTK